MGGWASCLYILALTALGAADGRPGEIATSKHLLPAPAPLVEYEGVRTPDGSFSVRDPGAPFSSEKLADALWLDAEGRDGRGEYLDLNHTVYTSYRLASDPGPPDTILVLMPGTWAGAMSMDRFARDVLRMAAESGRPGMQVWLLDRRSEQLEDHTGLWWAEQNRDRLSHDELIAGISDYYKPAFTPGDPGRELLGRRFTPLDHDAVRFMAGWGADVALRDWRAAVLAAHRQVGDEVIGDAVESAVVKKRPGRHVFIGGHSLGGSLTVLYASYDFDRRPDSEILGRDDVDGLVLLEGGAAKGAKPTSKSAAAYLRSLRSRYRDGKVYFDLDVLGIRYAPATMLSVGIMGWASDRARGEPCLFPEYARPALVRLPRVTNEAVLGLAMDDDTSPFFIARVSMGHPAGQLGHGGQLRRKSGNVPLDPGACPVLTPWRPGHRPVDPEYQYAWVNSGAGDDPSAVKYPKSKCAADDPEVTDLYDFARSLYGGPAVYEEAPERSSGPNDFPEWYFPPRLSTDAGLIGTRISDDDGTEWFNAAASDRLDLPVISFTGDDSMGEFSPPERTEKDFAPAVLAHPETQTHLLKGYTHLDITATTRNNQSELTADGHENYNASAVYTYRFMEAVAAGEGAQDLPRESPKP